MFKVTIVDKGASSSGGTDYPITVKVESPLLEQIGTEVLKLLKAITKAVETSR